MEQNSLVIFTQAAKMLAEAVTIQATKELKDLALTAIDWAKRKGMGDEAVQYARGYALEAERKMGSMLAQTERAKPPGDNQHRKKDRLQDVTEAPTLAELGLTKRESAESQMLAALPDDTFQNMKAGRSTMADVKREAKRAEIISKLEDIASKEAKAISGKYDVIVIDPPWDMQKIERDERPNQSEFGYPTMSEDELSRLEIPFADDCHVFVWTTQKYLPMALRLLELWKMRYLLTMVWHKPGGFQPFGLPQYNCEFAIYARIGTPAFIDTKAFPVCFSAPRGSHSEKPNEFYEMIKRVTAGRRLDMFGRRDIDGFDSWGNEA